MSMLDNVWTALQLFGLALFLLLVGFLWTQVTTSDVDTALWSKSADSGVGANIKASGQRAYESHDLIFIIVYIGMHLGILVLAYMLRNHPVMYVAALLITVVLVVVAAPLSNVWVEVTSDIGTTSGSTTTLSVDNLQRTDYIMKNFPYFEMIWAFLTAVVLLGVSRVD